MALRKPVEYDINDMGCHIVTSHYAELGQYPRVNMNGKKVKAHRWSYITHKGPIPDGMVVRHKCDNKLCINPDHLELGTHLDNVNDMVSRGRSTYGEKNPQSKLTEEQVLSIRQELSQGGTNKGLGRKYGVAQQTISQIRNNKIWKHL